MVTMGGYPGGEFDSGAVVVNDAVDYVEVCRIQAAGRPVVLRLTAGVAAIDALKVGQAAVQAAAAVDLAVGTDLNAAVDAIPYCVPAIGGAPAIAIGGVHEVKIDSGAADLVISAKGANTTLRVQGRVR